MADGQLYTVTELAKELGMTARAVRFYEDKGLITPRRAGTTRVYSSRDRARMILILRGKRLGFSLSTIKEYLDLYDADITQHAQIRLLLRALATRRAQLTAQRQAIDEAMAELDDIAAQANAALQAPGTRISGIEGVTTAGEQTLSPGQAQRPSQAEARTPSRAAAAPVSRAGTRPRRVATS